MCKLLIHVGYPKAASTTLQNKLFMELHRQGRINFLGRAFESGYSGVADRKVYKEWFRSVAKGDAFDDPHREYEKVFPELSSEKLNLLSEGMFLTTERATDDYLMPPRLHRFFAPLADKVEVLIVLRSPVTLVLSYYTQKYQKMPERTFARFLENNLNSGWSGEGKIFDTYGLVTSYAHTFGKENIHLVFFEDLAKDRARFARDLASVLGVAESDIDRGLGSEQLNVTRRDKSGYIVKKPGNSPRALLASLFERIGVPGAERLKIKVAPITPDQEAKLFEAFAGPNERLAREFRLDRERMQRYRYF